MLEGGEGTLGVLMASCFSLASRSESTGLVSSRRSHFHGKGVPCNWQTSFFLLSLLCTLSFLGEDPVFGPSTLILISITGQRRRWTLVAGTTES